MERKPWYKLNLFSYFVVLFFVGWSTYFHMMPTGKPIMRNVERHLFGWPMIWYVQYHGMPKWPDFYSPTTILINVVLTLAITGSVVVLAECWLKRFSLRSLLIMIAVVAVGFALGHSDLLSPLSNLLSNYFIHGTFAKLCILSIPMALLTLAWIGIKKYFFHATPHQAT